ncbi:MAG: hypothetical protein FD123_1233 [Bacteroidetes bacterium]|nr:MAG: hypothetical protein FD123_1233 [Bacteroidota bacterium]
MKNLIRKKWKDFLNPVYSPATSLLFFAILVFHNYYFHHSSAIHSFLRRDEQVLWLVYIYAPIVLLYNFVRIPGFFAGFASFVAFACTVFGIVFLEVAMMKSVRRPDVFDIIFQFFFLLQASVLTFRLVRYMRSLNTIFSAPKEMELEPVPLLSLGILALVPGLTLLCDKVFELSPNQVTNVVAVTGTIVIYLFKLLARPAAANPGHK